MSSTVQRLASSSVLTRKYISGVCSSALKLPVRTFVNHAAKKPAPKPLRPNETPQTFVTSLGRDLSTKLPESSLADWGSLWKLDGHALREAGLSVKDRRYTLWCMEKYRQGIDPREYAHPAPGKKKIRGHGPAVQFGKRIRSRRKQ